MSAERDLLKKIQKHYFLDDSELEYGFGAAIKRLLSEPEEPLQAMLVDNEYMDAFKSFVENQKVSDAKENEQLRDWFAGLAMQGFASRNVHGFSHDDLAVYAYKWADAMLVERDKRNG